MKILTANEGMWLTNGQTFSKKVFIGRTGNADDWREITEEEKTAIEAEQDAAKE